MLIVPGLALVLTFAIFFLPLFRLPNRTAKLLGLYLLCYADIVLVGQITNSFYELNNPWLWLAFHLACATAAWLAWRRSGRPDVWEGLRFRLSKASVWSALNRWPELGLLTAGVGLGFLFNAVILWIVPPNNNDSLATHMARVGYWLQRGSFFPWATDRVWQVTYPVNMQLQMFWTVLFLGTDRIVEAVQWLGSLAALLSVYGLARLLGATHPQALFATLLFGTFPEIALEASSTQNDLVAGALFTAVFYLLFLGLKERNPGALALSGLALGLGLGTKQTLLFLLPGLALAVLLVLWFSKREERLGVLRRLLIWVGSSVAAFLLLGIYMYVVNQVNFQYPLGPETAVSGQTGGMTAQSLKENLLYNSFRLAYQTVDPSGLPDPLTGYSIKLKALVVGKLTSLVGFYPENEIALAPKHSFSLRERYLMQEDAAWYGPVYAFLVIPALLYQFWVGIKKKDPLRLGIFALAVTFWLIDAAFRPGWDPFQGRYFIPVVAAATACAAFLFQPGRKMAFLRWSIVVLALTILTNTFLWSAAKPVSGEENILNSNRINMLTQQSFYMRQPVQMVERYVPADATLGLLTFDTLIEYPLFGENFHRRLVPIYPPERIQDRNWMESQGIEFVLVAWSHEDAARMSLPNDLIEFASEGQWSLLVWQGGQETANILQVP